MVLSLSGLWLPSPRNQRAGIPAISSGPSPLHGMTSPQAGKSAPAPACLPWHSDSLITWLHGRDASCVSRQQWAQVGGRGAFLGADSVQALLARHPLFLEATQGRWPALLCWGAESLPRSADSESPGSPVLNREFFVGPGLAFDPLCHWHPPTLDLLYPDFFTLPSQLPGRISCVP